MYCGYLLVRLIQDLMHQILIQAQKLHHYALLFKCMHIWEHWQVVSVKELIKHVAYSGASVSENVQN
jgi:hypothetical protein